MHGRKLLSLTLAFGLAFLVAGGCSKETSESEAEKAMERQIEEKTGHDAEVDLGGDVDLSVLPKALRYPGAKGLSRWSGSDESGEGTSVVLETGDSPARVVEWYKQHLSEDGWTQATTMQMEGGTMLGYAKEDEQRMVTVTVAEEEGKTRMTIALGQGK